MIKYVWCESETKFIKVCDTFVKLKLLYIIINFVKKNLSYLFNLLQNVGKVSLYLLLVL